MQAIILCGGKATRLAALHGDRPKALVPVAGRPFLEWQLAWLARGGVRHVHLAAGHMADRLAAWADSFPGARFLRDGRPAAPAAAGPAAEGGFRCSENPRAALLTLSLSVEPRPLGTGGGLRYAADFVGGDELLVVNGDTLLPGLDLRAMNDAARGGGWAAMAVTEVADASRFGTVVVSDGRVVEFLEKGRSASGWINGGVYRLGRAAVDSIPAGMPLSIETDLFPAWARQGRIAAVASDPPLLDMGTPAGLADMERWLRGGVWAMSVLPSD